MNEQSSDDKANSQEPVPRRSYDMHPANSESNFLRNSSTNGTQDSFFIEKDDEVGAENATQADSFPYALSLQKCTADTTFRRDLDMIFLDVERNLPTIVFDGSDDENHCDDAQPKLFSRYSLGDESSCRLLSNDDERGGGCTGDTVSHYDSLKYFETNITATNGELIHLYHDNDCRERSSIKSANTVVLDQVQKSNCIESLTTQQSENRNEFIDDNFSACGGIMQHRQLDHTDGDHVQLQNLRDYGPFSVQSEPNDNPTGTTQRIFFEANKNTTNALMREHASPYASQNSKICKITAEQKQFKLKPADNFEVSRLLAASSKVSELMRNTRSTFDINLQHTGGASSSGARSTRASNTLASISDIPAARNLPRYNRHSQAGDCGKSSLIERLAKFAAASSLTNELANVNPITGALSKPVTDLRKQNRITDQTGTGSMYDPIEPCRSGGDEEYNIVRVNSLGNSSPLSQQTTSATTKTDATNMGSVAQIFLPSLPEELRTRTSASQQTCVSTGTSVALTTDAVCDANMPLLDSVVQKPSNVDRKISADVTSSNIVSRGSVKKQHEGSAKEKVLADGTGLIPQDNGQLSESSTSDDDDEDGTDFCNKDDRMDWFTKRKQMKQASSKQDRESYLTAPTEFSRHTSGRPNTQTTSDYKYNNNNRTKSISTARCTESNDNRALGTAINSTKNGKGGCNNNRLKGKTNSNINSSVSNCVDINTSNCEVIVSPEASELLTDKHSRLPDKKPKEFDCTQDQTIIITTVDGRKINKLSKNNRIKVITDGSAVFSNSLLSESAEISIVNKSTLLISNQPAACSALPDVHSTSPTSASRNKQADFATLENNSRGKKTKIKVKPNSDAPCCVQEQTLSSEDHNVGVENGFDDVKKCLVRDKNHLIFDVDAVSSEKLEGDEAVDAVTDRAANAETGSEISSAVSVTANAESGYTMKSRQVTLLDTDACDGNDDLNWQVQESKKSKKKKNDTRTHFSNQNVSPVMNPRPIIAGIVSSRYSNGVSSNRLCQTRKYMPSSSQYSFQSSVQSSLLDECVTSTTCPTSNDSLLLLPQDETATREVLMDETSAVYNSISTSVLILAISRHVPFSVFGLVLSVIAHHGFELGGIRRLCLNHQQANLMGITDANQLKAFCGVPDGATTNVVSSFICDNVLSQQSILLLLNVKDSSHSVSFSRLVKSLMEHCGLIYDQKKHKCDSTPSRVNVMVQDSVTSGFFHIVSVISDDLMMSFGGDFHMLPEVDDAELHRIRIQPHHTSLGPEQSVIFSIVGRENIAKSGDLIGVLLGQSFSDAPSLTSIAPSDITSYSYPPVLRRALEVAKEDDDVFELVGVKWLDSLDVRLAREMTVYELDETHNWQSSIDILTSAGPALVLALHGRNAYGRLARFVHLYSVTDKKDPSVLNSVKDEERLKMFKESLQLLVSLNPETTFRLSKMIFYDFELGNQHCIVGNEPLANELMVNTNMCITDNNVEIQFYNTLLETKDDDIRCNSVDDDVDMCAIKEVSKKISSRPNCGVISETKNKMQTMDDKAKKEEKLVPRSEPSISGQVVGKHSLEAQLVVSTVTEDTWL